MPSVNCRCQKMSSCLITQIAQMLSDTSNRRPPSSTALATSGSLASPPLASTPSIHPWLLGAFLPVSTTLTTIIPLQPISVCAEARLAIELTPLPPFAPPCPAASAPPRCILPLSSTTTAATTADAFSCGVPQTRGALQAHLANCLLFNCRRLVTACK